MKSRRWVLIVASILIFWLLLIYHGWNLFKANERIKNLLLLELTPILGKELKIESVRVGLGTIHVMGVSLQLPGKSYSVYAEHVQVDYNLARLVTNRFDPKRLSEDLYIKGLKITIHSNFNPILQDTSRLQYSTPSNLLNEIYRSSIKELKFIRHIAILNSQIIYADTSGEKNIIHGIDGWINSTPSGVADLKVIGKLFASEQANVSISGRMNIPTGEIELLTGEISQYQLQKGIPIPISELLKLGSGDLQGEIRIEKSPYGIHDLDVTGRLNLCNCSFKLPKQELTIDSFKTQLILTNWHIKVLNGSGKINQTDFTLAGQIDSIFNPRVSLLINSDNFESKHFFRELEPKCLAKVKGKMRARGKIAGSPQAPIFSVQLQASALRFEDKKFQNFWLEANFKNKKLTIPHLNFQMQQYQIHGSGAIFFHDTRLRFSAGLSATGYLDQKNIKLISNTRLSGAGTLELALSGFLKPAKIDGTFKLNLVTPHGDFNLPGKFLYANRELLFESPSDSLRKLRLNGQINFSKRNPPTFVIDAAHAETPFFNLFNLPLHTRLEEKLNLDLSVKGWPGNFEIFGQTKWNSFSGADEKTILFFTLARRARANDISYQCQLKILPDSPAPIVGELKCIANNEAIEIKQFQLGESVYGTTRIPFDKKAALSGSITAQNAKINDYFFIPDSILKGYLAATIEWTGSLERPVFTGQISLYETFYKYFIGPYSSTMDLHYHPDAGFLLSSFVLNRADTVLLSAAGKYDPLRDNLDFNFIGSGFNIEALQFLFPDGKPFLQGKTFLNVAIDGSLKKPAFHGDLLIEKGKLWNVPFDGFDVTFNTRSQLPTQNHKNTLHLQKIKFWRGDQFQIQGSGFMPLRSSDTWSVDLTGNGNLLFFLPDLIPYFRLAEATGNVNLHIGGCQKQPRFTEGKLQFTGGKLVMASVVSNVTRLNARLEYEANGNFVRILQLAGEMGGVPFSIGNLPADTITGKNLQPFYFNSLGLSCGIFTFFTPEAGVPLNFTGLMENGEFGKFRLLGLEPGEPFMFAGPVTKPVLRGKIIASNMSFMYPFAETKSVNKDDAVVRFLENLYWDLLVIPDTGVRYQRSFPGAFDEVFVNLQLDDNYGSLHMTGIVADSSFRINGQVRSTQGDVEYLHMSFRIEEAGAQFDRTTLEPVVYGRALTSITDSIGFSNSIYLSLSTLDNTLEDNHNYELVKNEQQRGRWSNVHFRLSSNNPSLGNSEGQLLVALGYSPELLQERAFDAVGNITDNLLLRPLFRPIERHIARTFGLDYVRFNSQLTRNLIAQNVYENDVGYSKLSLLRSSRIIMGKYLNERLFMFYSGSVEVGVDYRLQLPGIGLHHTVDLEYRINPQLLLELAYDYDGLMRKNRIDKRVLIRHWFPF